MLTPQIMLADIYFTKGMPMQGWIVAGTPPRLLKALEVMNRNKNNHYKEPIMGEPTDFIDREERLATVWMAFIMDAGFTLNSFWNGSMDLEEVMCQFPISFSEFKGKVSSTRDVLGHDSPTRSHMRRPTRKMHTVQTCLRSTYRLHDCQNSADDQPPSRRFLCTGRQR